MSADSDADGESAAPEGPASAGDGGPSREAEIRALGALLGEALDGTGGAVQQTHAAIAARTFRSIGLLGAPVRVAHDGISRGVYATVRGALTRLFRAGGAVASLRADPHAPAISDSRRGSMLLGAINGAWGDLLAERHSELSLDMALRRDGADLPLEREGLAAAFPGASTRVVVFVHGLCETDESWWIVPFRPGGEPEESHGERLERDVGLTPLYLRYDSGLHISDNGRRLSETLDALTAAWPVTVEEIVLVGHSMGGLIARSAAHQAEQADRPWSRALRHVFCLGSPHLGAPLEKAANVAGWALGRTGETRALSKLLNRRSVGIKDLRFGSLAEADWADGDPDEFLRDRSSEVPFLETATYYFIGATLAEDPQGRYGSVVGDLLVRSSSASGAGRRRQIPFAADNGRHLGGLSHFDLLNHPTVYDEILAWLRRSPSAGDEAVAAG